MTNMILGPKVKAFTIMEVMITMVISCFLVMASLKVFLLFEHLVDLKNKQMENAKEVVQLHQTLAGDMDNAILIKAKDREISMLTEGGKYIGYDFEPSYIIRKVNELTDTFKIEISDFKIDHESITGYVNNIMMEVKSGGETYSISVGKEYTNDLFMNNIVNKN